VNILQVVLLVSVILAGGFALAHLMVDVFSGQRQFLSPLLGGTERALYRICRVDPNEETDWKRYAYNLLAFSAVSCLLTYLLLRLQHYLPLNPQQMGRLTPDTALSATIGYNTNASWQSFSGESAMSYFSQTVPLLFQFFASPAIGMAAAVAIIRGLTRSETSLVGNFWTDLLRSVLYIFLPLTLLFSLFLLSQGVIQNFLPYIEATTLEGAKQLIAQGPVAAQAAMKLLGTNGGGFFNANSAHPYENPTALCNFGQIAMMLLIPSAFPFYLGLMAKNTPHGRAVWTTMCILFVAGAAVCVAYEYQGNPLISALGGNTPANYEGKETRFGILGSGLFAAATTSTGTGAVNSTLDSFTPLGGMIPLLNMLTSEVIFGGVGSGIYGMILFVVLTIFIAGLMIGRTPDYLGKKIEAREIKYAMLAMIVPAFLILGLTAVGANSQAGLATLGNPGNHGFSEILYGYTSATMNNGSVFGGLSTGTPFWNLTLAVALFFGRYFTMIPMLAFAGSMAMKKHRATSEGSFPLSGPTFISLLIAVILLVGALTFFPALALGPIAEHFKMLHI
jgi:potassium-transporting ATPase potassium-binding subunit